MSPDDPRHGTNAGHRAHISDGSATCQPCKDAHAAYRRQLWRRKYAMRVDSLYVSPIGVTRRIRALQAIGWSLADQAEHLGYHRYGNALLNLTRSGKVRRDCADRVRAMYDALCETEGPNQRARTVAATKGFPAPIAWLGVDIDDPDAQPDPGWRDWSNGRKPMEATLEDFDWLTSQGVSEEHAAAQIGVSLKTIEVYRRRAKEVAA